MNPQKNELAPGISWIGQIDWNIRDFHSYHTSRGSTYNAYLVRDEKNLLIDTVKKPFAPAFLKDLENRLQGENLDLIIAHHAEPDHAGSLGEVIQKYPEAKILCTPKCRKILSSYHDTGGWKFREVKSGDTLHTGEYTFRFLETPMVHWPESMATHCTPAGILFSMDAFGQHYASSERFDDEVRLEEVFQEARTYYANIVMPYGRQVQKTLEKAAALDIDIIAPAHGIIWRNHVSEILERYGRWSRFACRPAVLVIYDSMWHSTEMMARAITRGASLPGVHTRMMSVRATGLTEIAAEVLDSGAVAFGSATLNRHMMPMMSALLTYIKGLKPAGKAGLVFGSTGWGRGGTENMMEFLDSMDFEMIQEPVKTFWRPDTEVLQVCERAGRKLAEKALELADASGKKNDKGGR